MKPQTNLSCFLTLLIICSLVLVSSCKKDDPTEDRDNVLGIYSLEENCATTIDSYEIVISAGDDDDALLITNIYNAGITGTKARIDGENFIIDKQTFIEYGGIILTIEGDGTFLGNVLNFYFTLSAPGYQDDICSTKCTMQ